MPHHASQLERQLNNAQAELAARKKVLDEKSVSAGDRRRDPVWRQLTAKCQKIEKRVQAAAAVLALDEDVKQRRAAND